MFSPTKLDWIFKKNMNKNWKVQMGSEKEQNEVFIFFC